MVWRAQQLALPEPLTNGRRTDTGSCDKSTCYGYIAHFLLVRARRCSKPASLVIRRVSCKGMRGEDARTGPERIGVALAQVRIETVDPPLLGRYW